MKHVYALLIGCLPLVLPAFGQEAVQQVRLKSGMLSKVKNLQNEPFVPETFQKVRFNSRHYLLVQFAQSPSLAERQSMAREGVQLFNYIPDNTFLATLPGNLAPAFLKKYRANGVFQLEPASKLAPELAKTLAQYHPDPNKFIAVQFFGNISKQAVTDELTQLGARIAYPKFQPEQVVFVHASAAVIQKITHLPFVAWISEQGFREVLLNANCRQIHGPEALSALGGRNLRGRNVTVGVGDNADVSTHLDFNNRLINRNPVPPSSHGTHVTGTVGGAGLVNPLYRGMAPATRLISQESSNIILNTPLFVNEYGMVLTNNSYYVGFDSCQGEGDYDILSNYVDAQMYNDQALLHVFAAGNDGALTCAPFPSYYGTIKSGFQTGKNVLTVGALDVAYSTPNILIAGFSSRGPVDDGRLKPEVVANGGGVRSTVTNNGYGANWGTSMAAPVVTGSLALLYERYRQLNGGANPNAALMKALVCNSADDYGNPGPDFTWGFGILNARSAVEALEGNRYTINTVNNGATNTFTITGVPAGTHQIKVMLYWADVPGTPYAATSLVNNLDLRVTAPDASVHLPLILNPAALNVNNNAVEGVDNKNNIEQVVINNPPAGNFTVSVAGTNIPSGSQQYVITWQVIQPSIILNYPFGGETMVPGEFEFPRWVAYGGEPNTFTIEYSIDNGGSWNLISNSVPSTYRHFTWTVPNTPTNQGLVRITRNGVGYTAASTFPFTILGQPSLTAANICRGYAQLSWTAVPAATGYEVMMLRGDTMQTIATTPAAATSYLVSGLSKDSAYWFSVRALNGTKAGRRSVARTVTPSALTCALDTFKNDLTPDVVLAPVTGRMFTTSQLGTVAPQVRIRNLGTVATGGAFNISYQINGGSIVTESSGTSIAAASTYDHTFTSPFNFSAPGTYTIKTWVDFGSDNQHANDTLITVVKQLQNDPLVLNPHFTEDFESAAANTYTSNIMGLDGLDRGDFRRNNTNGRARTFINTGFARSGNRAVTLDQIRYSTSPSADSLITTFNLSGYSTADQLWLDFFYRNQGVDYSLPGNQVWIRGNENAAWVPVFILPTNNNADFGIYRASTPVNITEALAAAVPAQTVSSSFQVKFGQQGFTSANLVAPKDNLDDGFTFDDVMISKATDDAGIQSVVSPNTADICSLTATETISIQVKNYSTATMTNVGVGYQVNGGATVNETIASLAPGEVRVYAFTQKANLSAFQSYDLKAWVHYGADNYRNNDTTQIHFNTVPTITAFPYLQGFETGDGYWYTGGSNSSWQWGTPAKVIINKAANGSKAWVTSLTGYYNSSEYSYLYSPCYDLSGLTQPVFSFSHISRTEDDCDCDYHWIEYSEDGVTWQRLGASGNGTNWYDHTGYQVWQASIPRWQVSSYDIPTHGNRVRFRFVMYSDMAVNYEGVGIDDVHIFDKAGIYSGADITSGLTQPVSGNSWIHFDMGGNRVVSINPNGQNLGNTSVKVYINTGAVRYVNNQYYLDRNIVIQPSTAPSAPVSVRYYFLHTEANNLIHATGCGTCSTIGNAYEAGVSQYSYAPAAEENGTLADNGGGAYEFIAPANVTVVPYDNGYYAEYQVNHFSEFWINDGGPAQNLPLPQKLGTFTAAKVNNTGLLKWTTLEETNMKEFIVEESADGTTYTSMGTVQATGNSSTPQQYQFIDTALIKGLNYYRLKMIDTNGVIAYSPVRTIRNIGDGFVVEVHPNPVQDGMLYITTSANCIRADLHDVMGRMVKSVNMQGTQNTLPIYGLSKGIYFINVVTEAGKKVQKVIID